MTTTVSSMLAPASRVTVIPRPEGSEHLVRQPPASLFEAVKQARCRAVVPDAGSAEW
jgi:hypothetical protein